MHRLALETSNQRWLEQQQTRQLALKAQARLTAGLAAAELMLSQATWVAKGLPEAAGPQRPWFVERGSASVMIDIPDRRRATAKASTAAATLAMRRASSGGRKHRTGHRG